MDERVAHGDDTATDDPLTILLVEDNPGDARYIREIFTDADGYPERASTRGSLAERADGPRHGEPKIVHESRLEDGLDELASGHVDIVLLDLNLPDSNGLKTLETLRERTESLPVVVLTGINDREIGMDALSRGADEYLVKDEITTDLLLRSVFHAIERKAHERELERYRTLIETVSDGVYAVDDESRFVLVNGALASMTGYSREELLGSPASLVADEEAVEAAEVRSRRPGTERQQTLETELHTADDRTIPVETNFSPLPLEDGRYGRVGVVRDITERKERERQLERQRNELATLNVLNELVHQISHLAIEASTREGIEELVCARLAESDLYRFAWIGEVDRDQEAVTVRTEAGVEDYPEEITITTDDSDEGRGPTERAVRTGEIQVTQNLIEDSDDEFRQEHAREYEYRSSAAIPVAYDETLYGVLNVYSARPDAFDDGERAVIGRLGEVLGHAINAIERKYALMSEDVVELRLRVENMLAAVGVDAMSGRIDFDRAIPVGDGVFLEYGTATAPAIDTLEELVERLPYYESVKFLSDDGDSRRFELRLTDPPVISTIATYGGRVESATITDGDYRVVVQIPAGADVSRIVDAVQEDYPEAVVMAQRHTTRSEGPGTRLTSAVTEELTEKQRAALESAYFAGFFDWPRESSGEEVAESMGVSASTFHQHIRAAEHKLFRALFDAE